MPNIEYTVMATDFAGHSFEHTYIRSTPDNVFKEPLNQPVVMAFTSSITDALRPTIMSAAPWVCARCRQKPSHFATRVILMKPTDPQYELQVVDRSMPTCKQGACEVYARDNVRAALADSEAGADVISYCKTCGSHSQGCLLMTCPQITLSIRQPPKTCPVHTMLSGTRNLS
ncbi:TPA: hypothetical protein ACH3X3_008817 [Trebouxia sp. C0006]